MTTHTPQELLSLWAREKISIEMAVGHILQNLVTLTRVDEAISARIDRLTASKPRGKSSKQG